MVSEKELLETVAHLRERLSAGTPLQDRDREALEAILADVGGLLEGEQEHSHQSLADRLGEATAHFEEEHMDLTLAVGALAAALSRRGI